LCCPSSWWANRDPPVSSNITSATTRNAQACTWWMSGLRCTTCLCEPLVSVFLSLFSVWLWKMELYVKFLRFSLLSVLQFCTTVFPDRMFKSLNNICQIHGCSCYLMFIRSSVIIPTCSLPFGLGNHRETFCSLKIRLYSLALLFQVCIFHANSMLAFIFSFFHCIIMACLIFASPVWRFYSVFHSKIENCHVRPESVSTPTFLWHHAIKLFIFFVADSYPEDVLWFRQNFLWFCSHFHIFLFTFLLAWKLSQ
jgi:hypothetical protein